MLFCGRGLNRCHRLDYQPLFRKGARAPAPNSLLGEERRPDSRERRKSSLEVPLSPVIFSRLNILKVKTRLNTLRDTKTAFLTLKRYDESPDCKIQ